MGHTHVGDEDLVYCVGHQGSNDLYAIRIGQAACNSAKTYDSLGSATVFLAVILEIIEDLGTRYYADSR